MNEKVLEEMIVDSKFFSTPDMGEYMSNRTIIEMAEEMAGEGKGESGLFYIEEPFTVVPGYYSRENVFVLSGKPSFSKGNEYNRSLSNFDGDTIYLNYNELVDGGSPFTVDSKTHSSIKDYIYKTCELDTTNDQVGVRILGINTPETPKFRHLTVQDETYKNKVVKVKIEDIKTKNSIKCNGKNISTKNFEYCKYWISTDGTNHQFSRLRSDNETLEFLPSVDFDEYGNKKTYMFELMPENYFGEKVGSELRSKKQIVVCTGNSIESADNIEEYCKQGEQIVNLVRKEIESASEIIYVLDNTTLKSKKGILPYQYRKSWEKMAENPFNFFEELFKWVTKNGTSMPNLGLRYFGQEFNGRCLGALYYKKNVNGKSVWINLAKKLIYDYSEVEVLPSYSNSPTEDSQYGFAADIFKLWTYNKNGVKYVDSLTENAKNTDDRDDIQKLINPFYIPDEMEEHTVMIGDCLLVVPPTSIKTVNQTESVRVPLMRAKGSIAKTIPKTERIIQMDLYFNNYDGINGFKVAYDLPSGNTVYYYMNGLRSLIAQFKFTPFLPIKNNYVNRVLNIEAVALTSYQISTVPNYPRLLKCTINMTEFNYRQFMPEILPPDIASGESIETNMFAKTIHWPVFRYYYQRALWAGEVLKDIEYNSEEYIDRTLGQRTALMPTSFETPLIEFYVANEENLKQRLQLKRELEKRPLESKIEFVEEERNFLFELAKLYGTFVACMSKDKVSEQIKGINDYISEKNNTDNFRVGALSSEADVPIIETGYYKIDLFEKEQHKNIWTAKNSDTLWTNYIVPVTQKLQKDIFDSLNGNNLISTITPWYRSVKSASGIDVGLGVKIDINWGACNTDNVQAKIRKFISKKLAVPEAEVLKGDSIYLMHVSETSTKLNQTYNILNAPFKTSSSEKFNDFALLSALANLFGMRFDQYGNLENADEVDVDSFFNELDMIGQMKDDLDIESAKSLKFDNYFVGYPLVTQAAFTYSNVFNNITLKSQDGFGAQFTGGSDTVIELILTTKDQFTVSALELLPKICTKRLIDYRKIITSSPLRIKSEISQLIGINEVIIESISTNTVENHPGLYEITMRLQSVDRTLRNRESLKKLDIDNAKHALNTGANTKNYFDVKNVLKRAELYPDLELPTIDELNRAGFYFIQHVVNQGSTYPDPDFYFVYSHIFTSEMIRDSVYKYFSREEEIKSHREIVDSLSNNVGNITFNLSKNGEKGPLESVSFTGDRPEGAVTDSSSAYEAYKNKYQKQAEEIMSKLNLNGKHVSKKYQKDIEDSLTQAESLLNLKEVLEFSQYGTVQVNISNKMSVSAIRPFGKTAQQMQTGSVHYWKDGFMRKGTLSNTIEEMNNTVKHMIKKILKKPIPIAKPRDKSVMQHPDYEDFFKYLFLEVAKLDKDKDYTSGLGTIWWRDYNFEIDGLLNDFNLDMQTSMQTIFKAMSSAQTGKVGRMNTEGKSEKEWLGSNTVEKTVKTTKLNGAGVEEEVVETKKFNRVYYLLPGQGVSSPVLAQTDEEIEKGCIFGQFGIRKYSSSFLSMIYDCEILTKGEGFLDPYYNQALSRIFLGEEISDEEAKKREAEYREAILDDDVTLGKGAHAMFRIMLVWLYKALSTQNKGLIPNSIYSLRNVETQIDLAKNSGDDFFENIAEGISKHWYNFKKSIFSDDENTVRDAEIKKQIIQKEDQINKEVKEFLKGLDKTVKNEKFCLMNGMWTMLAILAISDVQTPVYNAILSGNTADLENFILTHKDGYIEKDKVNGEVGRKIDRFMQVIDYATENEKVIGNTKKYVDRMNTFGSGAIANRIYLEMAEEPNIYLLHSFYDMVMNDARGRMLRAFPTFYMLLVDEGRNVGVWKLQDNFYDVSSITSIDVVKSRKIAADTASISMTNLFGTYTLEDEDIKDEYEYTFKDVFDSVFHVRKYVLKEHEKRKNAREINRANITPGTRVHLRAGYGADASKLPVLFNGCVAEVQPGEIMTLICQGDGVEISNPNMFNATDANDVTDLENNSAVFKSVLNAFSSRSTPRDMLVAPLVAKGTFVEELIREFSNSRFFFANPFGITHFGDRDYKEIFAVDGEVAQNIYEGLNRPSWSFANNPHSIVKQEYELDFPPQVRVELQGNRSYWDIMHIAASISPDFVCSIVPFDLRSSIFYGHPRYYYAYTYDKDNMGKVIEKRKPFQQYHAFTSATDIIQNGIMASQKDVRTNAKGIYTGPGVLSEQVKTVGPLFLDINIYPEYQKSTTINCNFQYKATDFPLTIPIHDWVNDTFDEMGGYQIAWRATANGLRDTVKEMYKGELSIVGYPAIKPYDRFYVSDTYEDMEGIMEVQQVVHTFSPETGFVTTITPDCISAITDDYDKLALSTVKEVIQPWMGTVATGVALTAKFSKITRAMFMSLAGLGKSATSFADAAYRSVAKNIDAEEVFSFGKYLDEDKLSKLGMAAGITPTDYKIQTSLSKVLKSFDSMPLKLDAKDFTGRSSVMNLFDDMASLPDNIASLNTDEFISSIDDALKKGTLSKKDQKVLEEAKDMAKYLNQELAGSGIDNILKNGLEITSSELDNMLKYAEASIKNVADPKDVQDAIKRLRSTYGNKPINILGADGKYTAETIKRYQNDMKDLKRAMSHVSDLDDDLVKVLHGIRNKGVNKAASALDNLKDAKNSLKRVKLIRTGGKMLTVAANLLPTLVLMGAEIALTKYVQDYIEKAVKNMQVLTVFPVFKNGKAYTAGLLGNQGSVYGSHTYEEEGYFQQMVGWFFKDDGGLWATVRDFFIDTTNIREILKSQQKSYQGKDLKSNMSNPVELQKNLLASLVSSQLSGINAYNQLFLANRLDFKSDTETRVEILKDQIVDVSDISNNRKVMDNLNYMFETELCKKLHKAGVLRFSAEGSVSDKDSSKASTQKVSTTFKMSGADVEYPCKIINRKGKFPIYDIPYLRPDAIVVLNKIVDTISIRIQEDRDTPTCNFKDLHEKNIIIHNGTRINENSYYSTGYAFSIEVKNSDIVGNILKEMDMLQKGNDTLLFKYRKNDKILANTWEVFVTARK